MGLNILFSIILFFSFMEMICTANNKGKLLSALVSIALISALTLLNM